MSQTTSCEHRGGRVQSLALKTAKLPRHAESDEDREAINVRIQNYECHRPPRANTEVDGSNHLHLRRRIYHDTPNRMRIGRQSMYACLQKAKCDEYDTMPRIEDYNRCTPLRAHTEVEKVNLRCSFVQGPISYHKFFNYFRGLHDIIVLLRITPAAR